MSYETNEKRHLKTGLSVSVERYKRMKDAATEIQKHFDLDERTAMSLAAGDLFVEKAQMRLTERATELKWTAYVAAAFGFFLIAGAGVFGYLNLGHFPSELSGNAPVGFFIIYILKIVALGGLFLVGVRFFMAIAQSAFHEHLVLLHRRHALRLGRLNLYLRRGMVSPKELVDTFEWNMAIGSDFQRHSIPDLSATPLGQVMPYLTDMVRAARDHR